MFNKDDILARLQNGDSVDEIATEMANALNAAKTSYDEAEAKRIEEEKKLAEVQAKANQEKKEKRALVDNILEDIIAYLEYTGHKDMVKQLIELADEDVDNLADALDAMIELAEMAEKFKVLEYGNPFAFVNPVGMKKASVPKPVQKATKPTPDDIISEFLKTL